MASERLVLDASFAIEALLPTSRQWQNEAFDLIDGIASGEVEARVPWIFFAELAYVVAKAVRGRRIDAADAQAFLAEIDALGLYVEATLVQSEALYASSIDWHVGAYDALYLSMAQRLHVSVATRDRGMASAARRAKVGTFDPTR